MLGAIRNQKHWNWCASGKHPVAKDYFKVGLDEPLLKAFVNWVESGFRRISGHGGYKAVSQNSWRFWARGPNKKILLCGVSKDSSDSFGRSYPLLIMGTGPLHAWEKYWDLLPFALENTWNHIEYISTKRFKDLEQLEDGIREIPAPVGDWPKLKVQRKRSGKTEPESATSPETLEKIRETINRLSNQTEWFAELDSKSLDEQYDLLIMWHLLLRKRLKPAPSAVFMGGIPEKSWLALFKRPLRPDDFIRLWSSCSEVSSA